MQNPTVVLREKFLKDPLNLKGIRPMYKLNPTIAPPIGIKRKE